MNKTIALFVVGNTLLEEEIDIVTVKMDFVRLDINQIRYIVIPNLDIMIHITIPILKIPIAYSTISNTWNCCKEKG